MTMTYPNDQGNPAAAVPVWIAPAPAATGVALKNITTSVGTLVKTGAGALIGLTINTPEAGASATVYDGTDNTGTVLGVIALTAQNVINFPGAGWMFAVGLYVVTAGGSPANITLTYL